jgi:hypothetical protein
MALIIIMFDTCEQFPYSWGIGWIGYDFYIICMEYLVKFWSFMQLYDGNVRMSTAYYLTYMGS